MLNKAASVFWRSHPEDISFRKRFYDLADQKLAAEIEASSSSPLQIIQPDNPPTDKLLACPLVVSSSPLQPSDPPPTESDLSNELLACPLIASSSLLNLEW